MKNEIFSLSPSLNETSKNIFLKNTHQLYNNDTYQTYIICGSEGIEPYLEDLNNQNIKIICVNLEFPDSIIKPNNIQSQITSQSSQNHEFHSKHHDLSNIESKDESNVSVLSKKNLPIINHTCPHNNKPDIIYEIGNFNNILFWRDIAQKYPNSIDKIIFDSSTSKFIQNTTDNNNFWHLDNICQDKSTVDNQNMTIFRNILKSNGEIYFDSVIYSCLSFNNNLFSELSIKGGTWAKLLLLPLTPQNEINVYVHKETFFGGDISEKLDLNSNSNFINYLNHLKQIANLKCLDILIRENKYNGNNNSAIYPLKFTTYPINSYLVIKFK